LRAPLVFQTFLHNHWIRAVVLLVIFSGVVLLRRLTWKGSLVFVIGIFALFGMFIDTAGHPVTNKPLEWI